MSQDTEDNKDISPEHSEVFEINDYTIVTELERFTVAVESIIQEWGLMGQRPIRTYPKEMLRKVNWASKSENIRFGSENQLRVTYYYPELPDEMAEGNKTALDLPQETRHIPAAGHDMLTSETDFVYKSNITTMFGVTEFLIFSPVDQIDDQIATEDQKNLVLSAFNTISHSVECEIPMFIQYGHVDRQMYYGTLANHSTKTEFQSAHLRKGQVRDSKMDGLVRLFKEKINLNVNDADAEIRVSVVVECTLEIHTKFSDLESNVYVDYTRLPYASFDNPLREIKLIASWPNMREEMVNENEVYSDLEPRDAFNWAIAADFVTVEGYLSCTLYRLLNFLTSPTKSETCASLLGMESSPGMNAFSNLTGAAPSQITFGPSSGPSITNPGNVNMGQLPLPITKAAMDNYIANIFDVPSSSTKIDRASSPPGGAVRESKIPEKAMTALTLEQDPFASKFKSLVRNSKGAPTGSLCDRFALTFMQTAISELFGPTAFAQTWMEFVKKLRYHYERSIDLPGLVDVSQPNLSSCLLHQKLEMLQCCLNARRKRHALYDNATDFGQDDFYDAQSDPDWSDDDNKDDTMKSMPTTSDTSISSIKISTNVQPSGRLHPFGEARLHKNPDVQMYVPITQDRSPMTEDMVRDHNNYLASLKDSEARVEAQLDTLRSDMQAFKAANPQCTIEDFIRWHSPKDWNEEEGALSERMRLEDNVWVKCWDNAIPIPVINQARLFNETKVAEEILSMLENATIGDIAELMIPILLSRAAIQMIQDGNSYSLLDKEALANAVIKCNRSGLRDDYLETIKQVKKAELIFLCYNAIRLELKTPIEAQEPEKKLRDKLPTEDELKKFVLDMIIDAQNKREHSDLNCISRGVPVVGAAAGGIGKVIREAFESDDGKMPAPTRKQYTFRLLTPRPHSGSRSVPQRMFASLERDEFRLCGSFTNDTLFF